MTIHDDAIDLIQYFEGCSNEAYACPSHTSNGGTWNYLTIGYGHSGPDVRTGQRITTSQARDLLARDMANVEAYVGRLVRIELSAEQHGAVCSLAMNLKPGLFDKSRTLAMLNVGDFGHFDMESAYSLDLGGLTGMSREWAEFRGIEVSDARQPQTLSGLVKRRAAELELFHTGLWSVPREDRMPQRVSDPKPAVEVWRPGMRSQDVADLHEALGAAGFPSTCGDAYTWVTAETVKAFQRAHGLEPDGLYGVETARALAKVLERRA